MTEDLTEIKSAVGESKKSHREGLEETFWWASDKAITQINDFVIEEVHKIEDEYTKKLLNLIGLEKLEDIPEEFRKDNRTSFDDVCEFVAKKLIQRMPTEEELNE